MKKRSGSQIIFFFGLVFPLFLACRLATPAKESPSIPATLRPSTSTSTPVATPSASATATLTAASESTLLASYVTDIAARRTETAASQRARDHEATLIAQFPADWKDDNCYAMGISPDGEWLATGCGPRENPTLVVQNKGRRKWVLEFKDFLSLDTPEGMPGWLSPKSWSLDGKYLYFTSILGYSGGGDFCFPGHGDYGLFRLHLGTGSWVTVIRPTDAFPGYEIDFAPTGRRYATTVDGLRITDLQTGEVTQINVDGVIMDLLWSPDGMHLAYSVARCGERGVESSWVYVLDDSTDQPELVLFSHEGILFKPESWNGNSTLRIEGKKWIDPRMLYTIYIYDLAGQNLMFSGTATPSP
ncbi:MAG: PD40 domain-containing protein [Anaerolineales bacterium]|nr:PD40 domain-containing protein [Anaerolineales bacterium]